MIDTFRPRDRSDRVPIAELFQTCAMGDTRMFRVYSSTRLDHTSFRQLDPSRESKEIENSVPSFECRDVVRRKGNRARINSRISAHLYSSNYTSGADGDVFLLSAHLLGALLLFDLPVSSLPKALLEEAEGPRRDLYAYKFPQYGIWVTVRHGDQRPRNFGR